VPLAYGIGSLAKMVDSNPNIAPEIAAIRAILSRAGDRLRKSNRALHQFLDDVARARQAVERSRQLLKTGPKSSLPGVFTSGERAILTIRGRYEAAR
jgi:hypothetical protein